MVEGIQETERSQEAIYREPEPRKEQVQDAQQGIALEMLQQQTTYRIELQKFYHQE